MLLIQVFFSLCWPIFTDLSHWHSSNWKHSHLLLAHKIPQMSDVFYEMKSDLWSFFQEPQNHFKFCLYVWTQSFPFSHTLMVAKCWIVASATPGQSDKNEAALSHQCWCWCLTDTSKQSWWSVFPKDTMTETESNLWPNEFRQNSIASVTPHHQFM